MVWIAAVVGGMSGAMMVRFLTGWLARLRIERNLPKATAWLEKSLPGIDVASLTYERQGYTVDLVRRDVDRRTVAMASAKGIVSDDALRAFAGGVATGFALRHHLDGS